MRLPNCKQIYVVCTLPNYNIYVNDLPALWPTPQPYTHVCIQLLFVCLFVNRPPGSNVYRVLASIVINATIIVSAAINSVSDSCTLFALSRHMWSSPRCYNYQPQLVDDGC